MEFKQSVTDNQGSSFGLSANLAISDTVSLVNIYSKIYQKFNFRYKVKDFQTFQFFMNWNFWEMLGCSTFLNSINVLLDSDYVRQ
jgi:hypothetical protein